MSHTEYRNGAIVEVDDSTGAAISTTALHHTDGYNKDVDTVLSASTSPVETAYTPVDCRELEATMNMLNHYSELVFSAQTDYCKIL